jgi:hypothetical protein
MRTVVSSNSHLTATLVAFVVTIAGCTKPAPPQAVLSLPRVAVALAYEAPLAAFVWAGEAPGDMPDGSQKEAVCGALAGESTDSDALGGAFGDKRLGLAVLEIASDALVLDGRRIGQDHGLSALEGALQARLEGDARLHEVCGLVKPRPRLLLLPSPTVSYARLVAVYATLSGLGVPELFFWVKSATRKPMPSRLLPKKVARAEPRTEPRTREELIEAIRRKRPMGMVSLYEPGIEGRELLVDIEGEDGPPGSRRLQLRLATEETRRTNIAEFMTAARSFVDIRSEDGVGCAVLAPKAATTWAEVARVVSNLQALGSERTILRAGRGQGLPDALSDVSSPASSAPASAVVQIADQISILHVTVPKLLKPCARGSFDPDAPPGECDSCYRSLGDSLAGGLGESNVAAALANNSGVAVAPSDSSERLPADASKSLGDGLIVAGRGEPTFDGEAPDKLSVSRVSHLRQYVHRCLQRAAPGAHPPNGELDLQLTLGDRGKVVSARVASASWQDADLTKCIERRVKTWRTGWREWKGRLTMTVPLRWSSE